MSLITASRASAETLTMFEILALLTGKVGVQGQLGHADDAVHGRADLVAHVGQEFALGPVGFLRRLLGHAQRFLGPLLFGHVEHRRARHDKIAPGIGQGRGAEEDGKDAAVLADHLDFPVVQRAGLLEALETLGEPVSMGRDEEVAELLADHFIAGITQPLQLGIVDAQEDAVLVEGVVTAGGVVVQVADLLGRFAQAVLGQLVIGDVARGGVDQPLCHHGRGRPHHPAIGAVLAAITILEGTGLGAAENPVEFRERGLPILGMHEVQERLAGRARRG